jgi:hypothetical protein
VDIYRVNPQSHGLTVREILERASEEADSSDRVRGIEVIPVPRVRLIDRLRRRFAQRRRGAAIRGTFPPV